MPNNTDIYVAVTGLTTSGGSETREKPVGSMFIHMLWEEKSIGIREVYRGKPEEIISQAVDRVARMTLDLIRSLSKN